MSSFEALGAEMVKDPVTGVTSMKYSFWEKMLQAPADLIEKWKKGADTPEGKAAIAPLAAIMGVPLQALESAKEILKDAPPAIKSTTGTIPLILIILAGGVTAYLVFMGRGGKKIFM
jgi:hypothetical protein